MRNIALVTGGAGFIGSHLCEALLSRGFEVICVDNLITGKTENIRGLESKKFSFIRHDITKPLVFKEKITHVFHLASLASPVEYQKFPIQTLKVGALGTHNALGIAKVHGAKFLFTSTSEVYGDPAINPQPESYWGNVNPIGTRSSYDESKRFGEALVMAYHREHKVDTRIARIFNTYGPKMRPDDGRVIPSLIMSALKNKDMTIYGTGAQTRSFCYISDQIDGLIKLMNADYHLPVNIGNPNEMTIRHLADEVLRLTKAKSKVTFKPLPADDPKVRRPEISLAWKVMQWKPKVDLEDGLRETIEWFRKHS